MIDTKMLKPGDEIGVWHSGTTVGCNVKIAVVKAVTPTGRVRLEDGSLFGPDGARMGHKDEFRGPDRLYVLTDAARKEIADFDSVGTILDFTGGYDRKMWGRLPTDAIRRIAEIIARHTGDADHAD